MEDAGPVTSRDSPPSATKVSVDVGPQQRALVALCALVALICAVDRAAMSVAILPMTKELHWSEATQGAVSSAFFLGYTATNPIAGTLASRGSAKTILAAGVVVWSLFTMATPVAATRCRQRGGCQAAFNQGAMAHATDKPAQSRTPPSPLPPLPAVGLWRRCSSVAF